MLLGLKIKNRHRWRFVWMLPGPLLRVPAAVPPPGAGMAKVKITGKKRVAHGSGPVWSN
jgi:hypothetical protein